MRQQYFVDTWYFIAYNDRRDHHYLRARRLDSIIAAAELVTHESVLTEVLAFCANEDAYIRATMAGVVRRAFTGTTVISVDRALFRRALDLYEARPDKHYSLTDCISFLVMRDRNIIHVLTNDHHFSQEGFTVLADAP